MMPTDPFVAAACASIRADGQRIHRRQAPQRDDARAGRRAPHGDRPHAEAGRRLSAARRSQLARLRPGSSHPAACAVHRSARGRAAGDVRPRGPGFRLADEPAARQQPRPPAARHRQHVRQQLHELPHAVGRVGAGRCRSPSATASKTRCTTGT